MSDTTRWAGAPVRRKLLFIALLGFAVVAGVLVAGMMGARATVHTKRTELATLSEVSEEAWQDLSKKTLLFGHRSVGDDILGGIADLMARNPAIQLAIVETDGAGEVPTASLAHFPVGKNFDPRAKIDGFAAALDAAGESTVDVAMMKLCYLDFDHATDADALFDHYQKTIQELKSRHPKTTIVHVAVPLTTVQTGPKAWIKALIGRHIDGHEDNMRRCRFNERVAAAFGDEDPIFDLATLEATAPDGTQTSLEKKGTRFQALRPEYTDDGGHLNATGRRFVAEQLLILLAGLKDGQE